MDDITHYTTSVKTISGGNVLYNSTSICRRDLELQQISYNNSK